MCHFLIKRKIKSKRKRGARKKEKPHKKKRERTKKRKKERNLEVLASFVSLCSVILLVA